MPFKIKYNRPLTSIESLYERDDTSLNIQLDSEYTSLLANLLQFYSFFWGNENYKGQKYHKTTPVENTNSTLHLHPWLRYSN